MAIIFKLNIQNKVHEANPKSKWIHLGPVRTEPGGASARSKTTVSGCFRWQSRLQVPCLTDRPFVSAHSYGPHDEPRCAGRWTFGFRLHRCDGCGGARCPSRTPSVSAAGAPCSHVCSPRLPAQSENALVVSTLAGAARGSERRHEAWDHAAAGHASHPEGRTGLLPPLKAPCLGVTVASRP